MVKIMIQSYNLHFRRIHISDIWNVATSPTMVTVFQKEKFFKISSCTLEITRAPYLRPRSKLATLRSVKCVSKGGRTASLSAKSLSRLRPVENPQRKHRAEVGRACGCEHSGVIQEARIAFKATLRPLEIRLSTVLLRDDILMRWTLKWYNIDIFVTVYEIEISYTFSPQFFILFHFIFIWEKLLLCVTLYYLLFYITISIFYSFVFLQHYCDFFRTEFYKMK